MGKIAPQKTNPTMITRAMRRNQESQNEVQVAVAETVAEVEEVLAEIGETQLTQAKVEVEVLGEGAETTAKAKVEVLEVKPETAAKVETAAKDEVLEEIAKPAHPQQTPQYSSELGLGASPKVNWTRVDDSTSKFPPPQPRHGHRAVAISNLVVMFGGGCEEIFDDLHVYNTCTNQWFKPNLKGEIPAGRAAFGFLVDATKMFMFGGVLEHCKYTNDVYLLQIPKWEWKKIIPKSPRLEPPSVPPLARMGHSFTLVNHEVAYLFGGLANVSEDPDGNIARYLNDVYTFRLKHCRKYVWDKLETIGESPCPRESHSAVAVLEENGINARLIVFGGRNGYRRLGDLWMLQIESKSWLKVIADGVTPVPRSLHSATVISNRMFIFGGWVPWSHREVEGGREHESEWDCTNSTICLNIGTMCWESLEMEDSAPGFRAGHSAVRINNSIYIWSGRNGYAKQRNRQVCRGDLWRLDVETPPTSGPVRVEFISPMDDLNTSIVDLNASIADLNASIACWKSGTTRVNFLPNTPFP